MQCDVQSDKTLPCRMIKLYKLICTYLMFTSVSKALCGQVVYGQCAIQICHSNQGQPDIE